MSPIPTSAAFIPFVAPISWELIEKGYTNLQPLILQLHLRSILFAQKEPLEIIDRIVQKSPQILIPGFDRKPISPREFAQTLLRREEPWFWFKMLEHVERTEQVPLLRVLEDPSDRFKNYLQTDLYTALISRSPFPDASWIRIMWGQPIEVQVFSAGPLPSFPGFPEQTGVTYAIFHPRGHIDHINVSVPFLKRG